VGRHIVFGLRYSSGYEECPPGDMFILAGNKGGWHPLGRRIGTITLHCNKPYSRGVVRLPSAEPGDEPIVAFNLASDARDLWRLVEGLKRMRDVMESPEVRAVTEFWFPSGYSDKVRDLASERFRNWLTTGIAAAMIEMGGPARGYIRHRKLSPGFDVEHHMAGDEFLAEWVRGYVWGAWHPSGTCRMGAGYDPGAVLDAACRVRGVCGLRVVDASVMPTIPRANTNIPTIKRYYDMSEARAAKAFLESHGLMPFLPDEYFLNASWMRLFALGGIRLQVVEAEAAQALELLSGEDREMVGRAPSSARIAGRATFFAPSP
jgi:5-(hydroxymethyl)furfural/furfural oxidase